MNVARLGCWVIGHAPWPVQIEGPRWARRCTQCGKIFREFTRPIYHQVLEPLVAPPPPPPCSGLAPALVPVCEQTGYAPTLGGQERP